MSIRKRSWTTRKGVQEVWLFAYRDRDGNRRFKQFDRKKDAQDYELSVREELRKGIHTAPGASLTVKQAGDRWLESAKDAGLERSTIDQYTQHLTYHIVPLIGGARLSDVTVPFVRGFQTRLQREGRSARRGSEGKPLSPAMRSAVLASLGALLADAQERGDVGHNAVRELRGRRRKGTARQERHKKKLKVGVDIPTPNEVRAILAEAANAKDLWRPLLLTVVFCGLRASELRGLPWSDMDLKKGELTVSQRADRYNAIGSPKSDAGKRTIPMPPTVVNELRKWKLVCPKKDGQLGLVFPNGEGNVESHANIVQRGLHPIMIAAGVVKPVLDEHRVPKRDDEGMPITEPKYSGLHAFRHFFASWCINRKQDGGLELPPKVVQERLGHESIVMTMDLYGHLFPRGDDTAELAAAERSLLG